MILNKFNYKKESFFNKLWIRYQLRKVNGEKVFKAFKLHQTVWPTRLYFYSPRLKGKARFTGDTKTLSQWKESKLCETLCPTLAISVTPKAILIDEKGCIGCGLCVDFAPKGLLEMSVDLPSALNGPNKD